MRERRNAPIGSGIKITRASEGTLTDGDLLVYDSATKSWVRTNLLDGTYDFSAQPTFGAGIKLEASDDASSLTINVGTTNTAFTGTEGALQFIGYTALDLTAGMDLKIRDSSDTDNATFSHDGTDFNLDFTTTTEFNINDIGVNIVDGTFRVQGVDTPSAGEGIEMLYSSSIGRIIAFNRDSSAYTTLELEALVLRLQYQNTTRIIIDSTGIGFFGAGAVAKPTGVAVTAAGIHAALVTLNLIAA